MEGVVRILCVDDEANVLKSLQRVFMDEEFETVVASSGEDALAILGADPDFAVIISDQRMPGMKGTDFLSLAREMAPDSLRILLTGYADINATIEAINRGGACRYMAKPWNDVELLQEVNALVGRYLLVKENRRLNEVVNRQNEELKEWNEGLRHRVLDQTTELRKKNDELQELIDRLKVNFDNSITAFSNLIELHNSETLRHSRNVSRIAVRAARRRKMPEPEVETIRIGALLHDVGKLGSSRGFSLDGVDGLSGLDLDEYMQHPVRGQAALDSVEELRKAGELIRHHHEYHDGTGFPDRLKGEDIPVGAQLIGMADFVDIAAGQFSGDNMVELAIAELKKQLGKRFAYSLFPDVAEAVRDIFSFNIGKKGFVEMVVSPRNLQEKMVVARDLHSGTGLFLLAKGAELDALNIQALKRYYQVDPPKTGVFVFIKK